MHELKELNEKGGESIHIWEQSSSSGKFIFDDALIKAGGFGRFQLLSLFCLASIRNMGLISVYVYAVLTQPVEYVCRQSASVPFESCSFESICLQRKSNLQGFEFMANVNDVSYFQNWLVKDDLMCVSSIDTNLVVVFYYFGFLFGLIFFVLPDKIGRKPSMTIMIAFNVVATAMTLFSSNQTVKSAGYFIIGMMH